MNRAESKTTSARTTAKFINTTARTPSGILRTVRLIGNLLKVDHLCSSRDIDERSYCLRASPGLLSLSRGNFIRAFV